MLRGRNTRAKNREAFTLFELCIAIFIGVMILLAAVPSIQGVIEDQRAKKLFNQFDDLAREASSRAVTEKRAYVIEWDEDGSGVTLHPEKPGPNDQPQPGDHMDFGERLAPDLILPAAMTKEPPPVWTFWPTATCEPAKVICHVPAAPWTATYDPLTEQAVFTSP
jgi:type II secretory pathway pseudopilin PulG